MFKGQSPFFPSRSLVDKWFDANKEAMRQVDYWLALRSKGQSPWGLKSMHLYLRKEFNFPFTTKTTFLVWLETNRPKEYAHLRRAD
jgi:hypothetical protein